MADGEKELVIRIRREVDEQGEAKVRAAHIEERKQLNETARLDKQLAAERLQMMKEAENRRERRDKARAEAAKKAERDALEATKKAEKEKADFFAAQEKDRQDRAKRNAEKLKQIDKDKADNVKKLAREEAEAVKQAERDKAAATKQAAKVAAEVAKEQDAAAQQSSANIRMVTRAIIGTSVGVGALKLLNAVMAEVADSANNAADRVRRLASEAAMARRGDRELAALTGQPMTVATTAKFTTLAAQAGVTPEEFRSGSLAFEEQAGQFIGDAKDPLMKMDRAQSQPLMQTIATYAAAKGANTADVAKITGTLISTLPKGATNDQILGQLAPVFKGMELAPGKTSPLLGQYAEIVAEMVGEGATFKTATEPVPLFRAMAQRNAGEASTYTRALMRGFRGIDMDEEKAAELGIDKKMNIYQKIKAFTKASDEFVAGGGSRSEFTQKYFPEIREFGAVETAIQKLEKEGGGERALGEMSRENVDTAKASMATYLASEEGRATMKESYALAAEQNVAARNQTMLQAEHDVRKWQADSGDLDRPNTYVEAMFSKVGQWWTTKDAKELDYRMRMGQIAAAKLETVPGGEEWMHEQGVTPGFGYKYLGSRAVDPTMIIQAFQAFDKLQGLADAAKNINQAADKFAPPVPVPAAAAPTPVVARP